MVYYNKPVPEGEYDRRFLDQELRDASEGINEIVEVLELVESARVERAIIRGSTTLSGTKLINYTASYIPDTPRITNREQKITVDEAAGDIIIGYNGLYNLSAYVLQIGGSNNQNYAWSIDINGNNHLFGSAVWTNAVNGQVYYAAAAVPLLAGDVISIHSIDSISAIVVAQSDLTASLIEFGQYAFEPQQDLLIIVATALAIGNVVDFDIYATIGDVVRVDYGNGTEVLTTITTVPETISGTMVTSTSLSINTVSSAARIQFTTNNLSAINLTTSSSLTSIESIVEGLTNLTSFDIFDVIGVTNMSRAFFGCTGLTAMPMLNTISSTLFTNMFNGCIALICLTRLNTTNQTDTTGLFTGASSLAAPSGAEQTALLAGSNYINAGACPALPGPDTFTVGVTSALVGDSLSFDIYADIGNQIYVDYGDGNEILTTITTSPQTIAGNTVTTVNMNIRSNGNVNRIQFNSATNNYETINITLSDTITSLQNVCSSLTNLTSFDISDSSNVVTFKSSWESCTGLTSFPLIDVTGASSLSGAWRECSGLTSFPLIDTSSTVSFANTWNGCTSLTSFPLIDTSNVTNLSFAWAQCSGLTSFPLIVTSSVTNLSRTWAFCTGLTSLPAINTIAGQDFNETFINCTSLVCLSSLNTTNQTNTTNLFLNCSSLVAPTAGEQTALLAGSNYVNAGACP